MDQNEFLLLYRLILLSFDPDHGHILDVHSGPVVGSSSCPAFHSNAGLDTDLASLGVAPTCRPGQMTEFEVGRGEIARIPCEVEANPTQLNYTWRVDTGNGAHEIPQEHTQNEGGRSVLRYLPRTEADFGILYCWGQNNVGIQTEPCQYQLIPAGIPDKLTNCSLTNLTSMSFIIECTEAYDGGLPQEFMIEVFNENQKLVNTIINRTPHFRVSGLDGGKLYKLRMFAFNKKGKSTPTMLRERTLEPPKRRTGIYA
ncbi:hypothetical protein EVAR_70230_1 [Eumeta japonica]|uniref:Ig-like domain-containing protein n=1 Tax=Eumeta variegata TaxID=151549 RepID=A0A4C1SVZ0_EUMVA|nr:hypothetical protein EVAR_70230_1 [Eumeta japonica]